jgi:NAD(P)-dependent dehydrogenase (short-subunit alcohol dehydrogenase family)
VSGAVVVGAGPGLGAAIAHRFAQEGFPITLVARSRDAAEEIAARVRERGVAALPLQADVTDEDALRSAIDRSVAEFGVPDVLVYNAALIRSDAPGDLTAKQHADAYMVNVVGALTAAAYAVPAMASRGRGSFIITGGMPQPIAQYTSLSLGKAAVRALAEILHQQYGPHGVHVATVTVYGYVAPGSNFAPEDIAERYWLVHTQPRDEWELDHPYTGTGT